MLDGFDSAIYIFVLVPALTELLRADGIEPDRATVALYGGYLFTIFMLGWACSMFWGWLADRIGRVSVMCLTILVYSFATALCGLAGGVVTFAVFRFCLGSASAVSGRRAPRCCRNPCPRRCACGLPAGCTRRRLPAFC